MEKESNAIFSITNDGINSKIKINTPPGSSVTTNSTESIMKNVEQVSSGGEITHNSNNLVQIGGSQTVSDEGTITNRVENGTLYQENLEQVAESQGEILNTATTSEQAEIPNSWYQTWWGFGLIGIGIAVIAAAIIYKFGWN